MEQLVRCRYNKITIKFDSSFDRPLSFIAEVLEKCGHPWTRSVFARVVQVCQGVIDSKFGRLASAENKRDDLITKTLSVLEDSIAATSPVAKVMFSGHVDSGWATGMGQRECGVLSPATG
ncbi:hypothetical protein MRX96_006125 [Rhipicephalus microplus]